MLTERQRKAIEYLRLAGKGWGELAGSHAWANGCEYCKQGMLFAPELNSRGTLPLYMQRATQAANGDITFCDCQAGVQMHSYLRRVWVGELKGRPDLGALKDLVKEETHVPPVRYVPAGEGVGA